MTSQIEDTNTKEMKNRVLEIVKNPTARSMLKRADIVRAEYYAYPYLAALWEENENLKEPVLLFASAVAKYPNLKYSLERHAGVGALGRNLRKISQDTVETRLISIQRKNLRDAHTILQGLYAAGNNDHLSINWGEVWDTYRWWGSEPGNPNRTKVLLDYYKQKTNNKESNKK